MHTGLEEFIFYSSQTKQVEELFSLYEKAMGGLGFDRYAILLMSDHFEMKIHNKLGVVTTKYPQEWVDYYLEQDYYDIDPMYPMCFLKPELVTWNEVVNSPKISRKQRNIFREAEDIQLYHGHNLMLHGSCHSTAMLSAASSDHSLNPKIDMIDKANLMSFQVYTCWCRLLNNVDVHQVVSLTPKEQEVLKWSANGLTKPEIGGRLNISFHTVDYHIRNIVRKLETKNITAAVAVAVSKRLISL